MENILKNLVSKEILKYAINKLQAVINAKAEAKHNHTLDDLSETEEQKILTKDERNKLAKITIVGVGDKFLAEDGIYKIPSSASMIDDTTDGLDKTYSSSYIKTKISEIHDHSNKELLDSITAENTKKWNDASGIIKQIEGSNEKFLSENGTYSIPLSSTLIDDATPNINKTYSSNYLNLELNNKSGINHTHSELSSSHAHTNKNVLDGITLDQYSKWNKVIDIINPEIKGMGNKYLADDGVYKELTSSGSVISSWENLSNKPFDSLNSVEFITTNQEEDNQILGLKYPTILCNEADYLKWKEEKKLDANTVYIVLDGAYS